MASSRLNGRYWGLSLATGAQELNSAPWRDWEGSAELVTQSNQSRCRDSGLGKEREVTAGPKVTEHRAGLRGPGLQAQSRHQTEETLLMLSWEWDWVQSAGQAELRAEAKWLLFLKAKGNMQRKPCSSLHG